MRRVPAEESAPPAGRDRQVLPVAAVGRPYPEANRLEGLVLLLRGDPGTAREALVGRSLDPGSFVVGQAVHGWLPDWRALDAASSAGRSRSSRTRRRRSPTLTVRWAGSPAIATPRTEPSRADLPARTAAMRARGRPGVSDVPGWPSPGSWQTAPAATEARCGYQRGIGGPPLSARAVAMPIAAVARTATSAETKRRRRGRRFLDMGMTSRGSLSTGAARPR